MELVRHLDHVVEATGEFFLIFRRQVDVGNYVLESDFVLLLTAPILYEKQALMQHFRYNYSEIVNIPLQDVPFDQLDPDLQEIERYNCQCDRTYYIENFLCIKDLDARVRPFGRLRKAQKKLAAVMKYCRDKGMPVRVIVLKSRKLGISTYVAADLYLEVKEKGFESIIIAQDQETAKFIREFITRFMENDPIDPTDLKYKNRKELKLADREGKIEVHTANEANSTRSRTPQYIHGSEVPKWEKGGEAGLALLNSIARRKGTTVIYEGTANGEDGYFYPIWKDAWENCKLAFRELPDGNLEVESFDVTNRRDWNHTIPLFISVLDDEEIPELGAFEDEAERVWFESSLDIHELKLIENHKVSLEFLNFRRQKIKTDCNNDEDLFNQEYPITPEMAFLASGRPRFNVRNLADMPVRDGEIGRLERKEGWDKRIIFKADKGENLTVFEHPVMGHRYVIGIDTSEGKLPEGSKKPDASVVIVVDMETRRQVATYCGQISEERLVEPALLIAEYYNGAFTVIETNSTGKHVAIQFRKKYPGQRLYKAVDWDKKARAHTRQVGKRTSSANRPILIGRIAEAIDQMSVILFDKRTIDECKHFVYKDGGRVEAAAHWHDDQVMAFGLALEGIHAYPDHLLPLNREGTVFDDRFRNLPKPGNYRKKTANKHTGY